MMAVVAVNAIKRALPTQSNCMWALQWKCRWQQWQSCRRNTGGMQSSEVQAHTVREALQGHGGAGQDSSWREV